jgi:hypothetical protein
MSGGGIRLNDEKVADPATLIDAASFSANKEIKLSSGKKKHGIVEVRTERHPVDEPHGGRRERDHRPLLRRALMPHRLALWQLVG